MLKNILPAVRSTLGMGITVFGLCAVCLAEPLPDGRKEQARRSLDDYERLRTQLEVFYPETPSSPLENECKLGSDIPLAPNKHLVFVPGIGSRESDRVVRAQETKCEVSDITWTLGPNLPEFRKGGCATVLRGKVISVFGMRQPWGEMATMYVYDPNTNWWQRAKDAPLGQTYVQGTENGEAFYAIGGRSRERGGVHSECYRLRSQQGNNTWDRIAHLNVKRAWAPSVSVGSKLYVFGGSQGGHGPTLHSVEMFDISTPHAKWQRVSDIPGDSRGWSGAAAAGGKVYLIGGSHSFEPKPAQGPDRKRFNETWQFDPDTLQWKARKPLPYRLSGFDCCVYRDRHIIVVGGCAETADFTPEMQKIHEQDRFHKSYYCPFVLVYDTQADQWHRLPTLLPMPTNDIRVVLHEEKLYALGGENMEPATSNTTPWLRIGRIHPREEQETK